MYIIEITDQSNRPRYIQGDRRLVGKHLQMILTRNPAEAKTFASIAQVQKYNDRLRRNAIRLRPQHTRVVEI